MWYVAPSPISTSLEYSSNLKITTSPSSALALGASRKTDRAIARTATAVSAVRGMFISRPYLARTYIYLTGERIYIRWPTLQIGMALDILSIVRFSVVLGFLLAASREDLKTRTVNDL